MSILEMVAEAPWHCLISRKVAQVLGDQHVPGDSLGGRSRAGATL